MLFAARLWPSMVAVAGYGCSKFFAEENCKTIGGRCVKV
jgi:hypothetical protein